MIITPQIKDNVANRLYTVYCHAVGGKAFDGKPLPPWSEFGVDPNKQKQADGWRVVAAYALALDGSTIHIDSQGNQTIV